jgi:hypothetical protein
VQTQLPVVFKSIDAVDDNPVAVKNRSKSKVVFNVNDNDTLNTVLVSPTNTNVTPGPLSIDSNGVVTLAGNTPSGSYSITYELCEVNPSTGLAVTPANVIALSYNSSLNPIDAVNVPVTVASNNTVVTALNA